MSPRIGRWAPAFVFAALTFLHAAALPTFEGMDEPAHLSSILHFAAREGRPIPGRARLHRSIERAVGLAPGPYHQWDDARTRLGGLSYAQWQALPDEDRRRRDAAFAALRIDTWQDGDLENWEAQHPPLYYALVGHAIGATGVSSLASAHRLARLISAVMFATTGVLLTAFITGPWGASPISALFVCLFPMWFVVGARISNDALAIPAFGLALLVAIDQMRRPAREWGFAAWLVAGVAAAAGIAAKAYVLVFIPVAAVAACVAGFAAARRRSPRYKMLFPAIAIAVAVGANAWWLAENQARTGWITGQNENASLTARGIVTLSDRAPYLQALVFDAPRRLGGVIARGIAQAMYISNWTVGAAPWWFYIFQLATIALIAGPIVRIRTRSATGPLRAAVAVAAIALLSIGAGIAKSVLDFYILFGEPRLAQGYYIWGAGCGFAAALALAFDATSLSKRRAALLLQALCLVVALVTDAMFWSGRYERDPVWRTPVRVGGVDLYY